MPADGTFAPTGPLVDSALNPRQLPVLVRKPIHEIIVEVAARRGDVTPAEMYGPRRDKRIAHARHEVMFEANRLGYTLHMIGRRFPREGNLEGHIDHSTVCYGIKKHRGRWRAAKIEAVRRDNDEMAMAYRDGLRGVD